MDRALTIAAVAASLLTAGCAPMWDAVTSRKFRDAPYKTVKEVIVPEDPMVVLRADPPRSGDDRAKAMHRLKEPIRAGYTQEDQDRIVEMLERTATSDTSPVLRYAAIEALGRFEDERAPRALMLAYQKADGLTEQQAAKARNPAAIVAIGGTSAGRSPTRPGLEMAQLAGPAGYAPDTVAALRCRCLESLGRTHRPEAARFLATVAGAAGSDVAQVGADDAEVRQAAVRGLGQCRQPEAVAALAQVLAAEAGKDPPLARGAHAGLVRLTGKKLPPDPQQWNEVVQAGVTIAPEPTWTQNLIQSATFWEKK
ncbi:MAG: hypothetical protein J0I06_24045 [Planctomycetes bacterium]|nr:hypothetical protein [Planctomycetota bacterium]